MAKVVQFPINTPQKLADRRVKKRRKPDLEDLGQLNLFDQAKLKNLNDGVAVFEEALLLDNAGDDRAESLYLQAIEKGESIEDALCNLAVLYSAKGQTVKAIDCLTQCLEKNPRHFEAHYNLGNAYSDVGNLALARTHYEMALVIDPNYSNAHYNLGLVLISMKQFKKAIHHINQYIELAPNADVQPAKELLNTLTAIAQ